MRTRIGLALALILAACSSPTPSGTASADVPPAIESASPTASVAQPSSPGQSAIPLTADDLQRDGLVEVTRDGVALLRGPGMGYLEVDAMRTSVALGVEAVGAAYVLRAGERLFIQDGPLRNEGTDWYSVRPAQSPELGDLFFAEGWMPVGEGGETFLQATAMPDPSCCLSVAGVGSGATLQVPPLATCTGPSACGRAIAWVAGLPDPADTCELRITQGSADEPIIEERIEGWARGAAWWPEGAEAAVVVETDCSWSLHLRPA